MAEVPAVREDAAREGRRAVRLADLDSRGLALQLPGGAELVVTPDDVVRFLVREGKAARSEAVLYLAFCASRGLNPLEDDAFLVKYDEHEPARIVLGKHGYLKLAHRHPEYGGHTSGVIVRTTEGKVELREGTFYEKGKEALVGGWAEVYRRGRPPYPKKVLLEEFNLGRKMWRTMPALMIEKVAVVQALREALPDMGLGVVVAEGEAEPEDQEARERKGFWAAAQNLGFSHEDVHRELGVASVKDWLAQGKSYGEALDLLRSRRLAAPERRPEPDEGQPPAPEAPPPDRFNSFGEVAQWAYETFGVGPMKVLADFGASRWEEFGSPDKAALLIETRYGGGAEQARKDMEELWE